MPVFVDALAPLVFVLPYCMFNNARYIMSLVLDHKESMYTLTLLYSVKYNGKSETQALIDLVN